jgi:CDP-paratose 2-epimerase
MSCIYGPHQFGTEDQGWVAYFLLRSLLGEPITIYGDGMQVRDVLFVDDLVDALIAAHAHIDRTAGHAFNIGGGPAQAVSLLELLDLIGQLHGRASDTRFDAWRPGDQRYYVTNPNRFHATTGWAPRTAVREGLGRLSEWLSTSLASAAEAADGHRALASRAS